MPESAAKIPHEYLDILRQNGGRVTPIVSALLRCMHASEQVYSPQQLKDELSRILCCDVGFPTIYRALDRLMQCKLIHRMHRDDGQTMFFVCRHPANQHHHHFICTSCRKVFEIDMCMAHEYESHLSQHLEATITNHIIQLEGVCKACKPGLGQKEEKQ